MEAAEFQVPLLAKSVHLIYGRNHNALMQNWSALCRIGRPCLSTRFHQIQVMAHINNPNFHKSSAAISLISSLIHANKLISQIMITSTFTFSNFKKWNEFVICSISFQRTPLHCLQNWAQVENNPA